MDGSSVRFVCKHCQDSFSHHNQLILHKLEHHPLEYAEEKRTRNYQKVQQNSLSEVTELGKQLDFVFSREKRPGPGSSDSQWFTGKVPNASETTECSNSRVQAVLREIAAAAHGGTSGVYAAELQIEKHLNSAVYGEERKKRSLPPFVSAEHENSEDRNLREKQERGMSLSPNIPYDSSTETWLCPFCNHRYRAKLSIQIHIKLIHFQEDIGDYNLSVELHSPTVTKSSEIRFQWDEYQYHEEYSAPKSFNQVPSEEALQWQSGMEYDTLNQPKTEFTTRNDFGNDRREKSIAFITSEQFGAQESVDRTTPCGTSSLGNRKRTRTASIKCPHCSKMLSSQRSFETHLRLHSGDKPFQCANCQSRFASVQGLAVHSGSQRCTRGTGKPDASVSAAATAKDACKRAADASVQSKAGHYNAIAPKISENSGKALAIRKEDPMKVYGFDEKPEQQGNSSPHHSANSMLARERDEFFTEDNCSRFSPPVSKHSEYLGQLTPSPVPPQSHKEDESSKKFSYPPHQRPEAEDSAPQETFLESSNSPSSEAQKTISNDCSNVPSAEIVNDSSDLSSQGQSHGFPMDSSESPVESGASNNFPLQETSENSSKEFTNACVKQEAEDMAMDLEDISLLFPDITFVEESDSCSEQINPEQPWEVPVTWEELYLVPVSSIEAEHAASALSADLILILQNKFCEETGSDLGFDIRDDHCYSLEFGETGDRIIKTESYL